MKRRPNHEGDVEGSVGRRGGDTGCDTRKWKEKAAWKRKSGGETEVKKRGLLRREGGKK